MNTEYTPEAHHSTWHTAMITWFHRERGWWMVNPLWWLAFAAWLVLTVLCRDWGRAPVRGK